MSFCMKIVSLAIRKPGQLFSSKTRSMPACLDVQKHGAHDYAVISMPDKILWRNARKLHFVISSPYEGPWMVRSDVIYYKIVMVKLHTLMIYKNMKKVSGAHETTSRKLTCVEPVSLPPFSLTLRAWEAPRNTFHFPQ